MARARNIKPSFFKNEDLVELAFEYRLLFIGMWTLADRDGRLEDRPKRIKMELFPADDIDIRAGIAELEKYGFVERYTAQGVDVILILNFAKHQSPHHTEKKSDLPDKDEETEVSPLNNGEVTVNERKYFRGNPPDSLNPDSLNHESNTAAANAHEEVADVPTVQSPPVPSGEPMPTGLMNALGTAGWPIHRIMDGQVIPMVRRWEREGVTPQQVADAIAIAISRCNGLPSKPTYLDGIVNDLREGKPNAGHQRKTSSSGFEDGDAIGDEWLREEREREAREREAVGG